MTTARPESSMALRWLSALFALAAVMWLFSARVAHAATAREINHNVDNTLAKFYREVKGGKTLVQNAAGVLVFPTVIKAGIGIGGQTGVGALRIHGKTVAYYRTTGGSFGFQFGGQTASVMLVFMQKAALNNFRHSSGWEVGVDGSVTLVKIGAGGAINTATTNKPILAFVFGRTGFMYSLSLQGSKYSRIHPAQG